jgi:hypothetical protein
LPPYMGGVGCACCVCCPWAQKLAAKEDMVSRPTSNELFREPCVNEAMNPRSCDFELIGNRLSALQIGTVN